MKESKCAGCGATIVWAVNPATGKKVPLDPRAPIYRFVDAPGGPEALRETDGELMVSHFATCTKAADFSGRNKGK